jgi:hypothetical protein
MTAIHLKKRTFQSKKYGKQVAAACVFIRKIRREILQGLELRPLNRLNDIKVIV